MEKPTTERLLKFCEYAEKISCVKTHYGDYIFKGSIFLLNSEVEAFQELVSNTPQDDNSIKMKKLITEERCRLLRKRKDAIEGELARLESKSDSDSIWKF